MEGVAGRRGGGAAAALARRARRAAGDLPAHIAPSLFDALVSAYHAGGETLRIAQQAIQMQTIVNLVSGGMGVAWVPESLTHLRRAGVRYARVSGLARPVAALRDQPGLRAGAAPVVERFVEHVRGAPRRSSQAR